MGCIRDMKQIDIILENYTENAAFFWLLRNVAIGESHYKLSDLDVLDNRVEANIDGLRIAGETGWEICNEVLALDEPGEIFTKAVLALERGSEDKLRSVLEAVGETPALADGLISAFGWLPLEQAMPFIHRLIAELSPILRYIGIASSAIHRKCEIENLVAASADEKPMLRKRAIRAIGEMGNKEYLSITKNHLDDEDEHCRFWAAWTAARFKDISATPVLMEIAEAGNGYSEEACKTALRLMHPRDANEWLTALQKNSEYQRLAAAGAGALGDPAMIPWLIEKMTVPELARCAGEAFTFITGVDIAYEDLEGEWPESFEAGPTEDPEDDNVDLDPDEDLPWPEPELIAKWWDQNKRNFKPGIRYLLGKPITEEHLQYVLRYGYQRQRAAAAIELAMINPGTPLFEVRAPGFRQKQWLGLK